MPSPAFLTSAQISITTTDLRLHAFWVRLLVGLLAGWLAGFAFRGRGFGCITDILLGLCGAVIGGWIFDHFGLMGGDFLYSLAAATLGAMLLVALARIFTKKPQQ